MQGGGRPRADACVADSTERLQRVWSRTESRGTVVRGTEMVLGWRKAAGRVLRVGGATSALHPVRWNAPHVVAHGHTRLHAGGTPKNLASASVVIPRLHCALKRLVPASRGRPTLTESGAKRLWTLNVSGFAQVIPSEVMMAAFTAPHVVTMGWQHTSLQGFRGDASKPPTAAPAMFTTLGPARQRRGLPVEGSFLGTTNCPETLHFAPPGALLMNPAQVVAP